MVSSIAYTQSCCVENKDTQAEKLKIPLTLKRSKCNNGKTNLNYDCNDLVIKNTWTTLLRVPLILKVHCRDNEINSKQI